MRRSKIEKLIKDDYNKNYKYVPNKEKLFKDLGIEVVEMKEYSAKWMRISKVFMTLSIVLTCCLIGVICVGFGFISQQTCNPRLTSEFKEYVNEYSEDINELYRSSIMNIKLDDNNYLYLYKIDSTQSKDGNIYYFYFVRNKNKIDNAFLVINYGTQIEIELHNKSFGMIAMHTIEQEEEIVQFAIRYQEKTKKYYIN